MLYERKKKNNHDYMPTYQVKTYVGINVILKRKFTKGTYFKLTQTRFELLTPSSTQLLGCT